MTPSFSALVEKISGWTADTASLVALLRSSLPLLQENAETLPNILEAFSMESSPVVFMFLLEAFVTVYPEADHRKVCEFLKSCSQATAASAPSAFTDLGRRLKDWAVKTSQPKLAILPLRSAILKLQPTPEHLTPLHADFFQVCLLAKCYHAAVPILEQPIYNVAADVLSTTPRDFMLYAYYGGLLQIGRKEYGAAMEMLLHAVTTPATTVSAIAVAAYQKYALVHLVDRGTAPVLPKRTPSIVGRYIKTELKAYQELINAFTSGNVQSLERAASAFKQAFDADGNWGLIRLCLETLRRRKINRLTHTHLTLSLQGIAEACDLDSPEVAEDYILQMVGKGEIFASIDERGGMVSFEEDPEQYRSAKVAALIDARIKSSIVIDQKLAEANNAIRCDPAYLSRLAPQRSLGMAIGMDEDAGPSFGA
uniref:COP9 signalosome complex subunit 3 n=1 Tax=Tetraselmis sp. GSL018 TaxID=582737 RepID=A0A061R588_9CHLO